MSQYGHGGTTIPPKSVTVFGSGRMARTLSQHGQSSSMRSSKDAGITVISVSWSSSVSKSNAFTVRGRDSGVGRASKVSGGRPCPSASGLVGGMSRLRAGSSAARSAGLMGSTTVVGTSTGPQKHWLIQGAFTFLQRGHSHGRTRRSYASHYDLTM